MKLLLIAALMSVLIMSCTGKPAGVEPVADFKPEQYLGKWHEIARLDHSFERGLTRVTAEYSLMDDGGIKVVNRGYSEKSGKWQEAVGKAYFTGDRSTGHLKVSFFGPFYGSYIVFGLDHENYRYSLVSGPDKSYLWILSRSPKIDPVTLGRLKEKAGALGFPVGELIFPAQ